MIRSGALALTLVLGLALAWFACKTPPPAPASAPATAFSSERAFADVKVIGAEPHPVGSAAHDRVRDYLIGRLKGLGLQVRTQRAQSFKQDTRRGETWISGADIENIIAVMPGRDPKAKALVVSAHYDSAPASPGAADDSAGVASALEVARVMKHRGQPVRDVIFLITDGEELGLLGAKAFFEKDPDAARVGAVVNMDTRGGGGRTFMFETGRGNGEMIDVFRRTAIQPSSNALAVFLYEHMPNGTDFTLPKDKGIQGLNYAFIGRSFDYHAASSTPERLEKGALQNMGDQVLASSSALAFGNRLPAKAPDLVYSDVFGTFVIAYPPAMGWLVLALGVALVGFAVWRFKAADELNWLELARGASAALFLLLLSATVLHLARVATLVPSGFAEQRPLLAQFPLYEAALAALGLGLSLRVFGALQRGNVRFVAAGVALVAGLLVWLAGQWIVGLGLGIAAALLALFAFARPVRAPGAWAGFAVLCLVFALIAQVTAPTIAFLFAWPLVLAGLAGAAAAMARSFESPTAVLSSTILGLIGLGWAMSLAHGVALGIGTDLPAALGLLVFLGALALAPLMGVDSGAFRQGAGVLALGWILIAVIAFRDPTSVDKPRISEVVYVRDIDSGKTWRASLAPTLDRWSDGVLKADGGTIGHETLAPLTRAPVFAATAKATAVPASGLRYQEDDAGSISVYAPQGYLQLTIAAPKTDRIVVAGVALDPKSLAHGLVHLSWLAARTPAPQPQPILSLRDIGPVSLKYALLTPGWPSDITPIPPRPKDVMPWYLSDATAEIGTLKRR